MTEQETLARQLHEWYLEATAQLHPESYNPKAQKPYDDMTEEQKFMDRYIAGKILSEKCTKCNSPFLPHEHRHITKSGTYHTACYNALPSGNQGMLRTKKNLVDNGLTMNERFDKYASNFADFFQETKVIEMNQALVLAKTELILLLTEIVGKKITLEDGFIVEQVVVYVDDIISIAKEWGIKLD